MILLDETKELLVGTTIALIGGVVAYIASPTEPHSIKTAFIKGISSGFIGLLVGLLAIYWQIPSSLSYFLCGTSGYMGSEITIALLKKYIERKINNLP